MQGTIMRVSGPVVVAQHLAGTQMYEVVRVGDLGLIGEVIRLEGDRATIQVYEDTSGLEVGDAVEATGGPLQVELGPGLLRSIFDGIQRPLPVLRQLGGDYISRGVAADALDRSIRWPFTPLVHAGDVVGPGDTLGTVPETQHLLHRIMVPPAVSGVVAEIHAGEFSVDQEIGTLRLAGNRHTPVALTLCQRWPVRRGRPYVRKLDPDTPLITGQRVIDAFFPVAKGGTAIIPGGFGSGKTVTEQTLARWADADIVVYVGCGERGNEMTEVLAEFPQVLDPRTGQPLMNRTVLVANTSNMPVAAREASIYTGITLAEYYRDMGYDVALMADSTSRWGEALREVSGRLEEMPGEEGYPRLSGHATGGFLRARRARGDAGQGCADRIGHGNWRCFAARGRLFRTDDPEQSPHRRNILGIGYGSGPSTAFSGDQLDHELLAVPFGQVVHRSHRSGLGGADRHGHGLAATRSAAHGNRPTRRQRYAAGGPTGTASDRAHAARGLSPAVRSGPDRQLLSLAQAVLDAARPAHLSP